jgi:hypothetical protein
LLLSCPWCQQVCCESCARICHCSNIRCQTCRAGMSPDFACRSCGTPACKSCLDERCERCSKQCCVTERCNSCVFRICFDCVQVCEICERIECIPCIKKCPQCQRTTCGACFSLQEHCGKCTAEREVVESNCVPCSSPTIKMIIDNERQKKRHKS